MSGISLLDGCKMTINWKKENDVTICLHRQIFLTLPCCSCQVNGPSFMSISWLILELWQFSCIKDWSEIPKSEIPLSALCPISGNWRELGIPNALKCQGYNFYRFWVIKRKPAGEKNYPGSTICFYFFIVCILATHSF